MIELPEWLKRCRFYFMRFLSDDSSTLSGWHDARDEHLVKATESANLIGSQFVEGRHPLHKLFIDLDVEHWYVPSSTEGHGHLYVNVDLTPEELQELMNTLAGYGIVGKGWAYQVQGRGENTFRLPGHYKTEQEKQLDKFEKESEQTFARATENVQKQILDISRYLPRPIARNEEPPF